MELGKLLDTLEKKGLQTLGQLKSVLFENGIAPDAVWCSHPDIEKTIAAVKPVVVAAAGTGAGAVAGAVNPAAAPIAAEIATAAAQIAADALAPRIEHALALLEDRLHAKLCEHFSPVHASLTEITAAIPAPSSLPPMPTVPNVTG